MILCKPPRVLEEKRQIGLDRKTVTKYVRVPGPPQIAPRAAYPHLLNSLRLSNRTS